MLPWTFFRNTVSQAALSLVQNAQLVTKVYFPRIFCACCRCASWSHRLVRHSLGTDSCIVTLRSKSLLQSHPRSSLFIGSPLSAPLVWAQGLAAINVRFRDVRFTIPFFDAMLDVLRLPSFIPHQSYRLNIAIFWASIHWPVSSRVFALVCSICPSLGIWSLFSSLVTLLFFVFGLLIFRRTERYFADVI